MEFIVGLDLGQAKDYTAIAVLERYDSAPWIVGNPLEYHLRHLERPTLGTTYPAIVQRVAYLLDAWPLAGCAALVVDATGVGAPVVDLLNNAGLRPIALTITGGDAASTDGLAWRVPKRQLVSNLQILFQSGRLKIAEGIPEASTLVRELLNFRAKVSAAGSDTYEAWREGDHDDLVLAVAMATYYGEQGNTWLLG